VVRMVMAGIRAGPASAVLPRIPAGSRQENGDTRIKNS
jgi:hypothetical protein